MNPGQFPIQHREQGKNGTLDRNRRSMASVAIRFKDDVASLVSDLQQLGYPVEGVRTLRGSPGRTADVVLQNQVVVSWDRSSKRVWAAGPYPYSKEVERLLKLYYQGSVPLRFFLRLWRTNRGRAAQLFARKAA